MTNIAEATQIDLRYDGGVGGGADNHALNVGLRLNWQGGSRRRVTRPASPALSFPHNS